MIWLGDLEGFQADDFKMYLETKGIALVKMLDENQEMQYTAKCFINSKNTIGYAEVDIQDRHEFIFLSKTAKGDVITMPGEPAGPLPIKAEGVLVIYSVPENTPVESVHAQHVKAMGDEVPLVEPTYIQEQVPKLPQRSLDIALVAINEIFAALGGAGGLMEAMGNAMGGMMEGIGKALSGNAEVAPDEKQQPPKTEPAPKKTKTSKAKPKKRSPKPRSKGKKR